jgi:acyl-CoA hydrolase
MISNGKTPSDSRLTLTQLMTPEHANMLGNVHGGWIMKLVDEAGGMCATRHARRPAVTVAMDSMTFDHPVHLGELLELTAEVTWTGRTAIEVEVQVIAENALTGQRVATNSAYVVYVTLGADGRPAPVPPIAPQTDAERARMAAAQKRQDYRMRMRAAKAAQQAEA